jgi:hypothetical protein
MYSVLGIFAVGFSVHLRNSCYDVTILNTTYSTYINEDRAKPVHGGPLLRTFTDSSIHIPASSFRHKSAACVLETVLFRSPDKGPEAGSV